jgi:hypothetical protein
MANPSTGDHHLGQPEVGVGGQAESPAQLPGLEHRQRAHLVRSDRRDQAGHHQLRADQG